MASSDVSLPDELFELIEDRAKRGGFSSPAEYVRHLMREDRRREHDRRLEALLLDGLDSGPAVEISPDFWEAKRRELADRHASGTLAR